MFGIQSVADHIFEKYRKLVIWRGGENLEINFAKFHTDKFLIAQKAMLTANENITVMIITMRHFIHFVAS